MLVDSVLASPLAADSTRDTFPLMPLARFVIKSGIQLCMSARGPVSGTEKCRKFRMALATEDAALRTLSMAPLIPEAILLTRSEPQDAAEFTTFITDCLALVKPFVIAVLMLLILPVIAESMLWNPLVTDVFRLVTVLLTEVFILVHAVDMLVFRLLTVLDTLDFSPFQAVVTLLAICGLTHRQSYKDVFAITLIKTLAVFLIIAIYYATGLV